eukprot:CAMPEP_0172736096 /NCGR_PEP_ID=MMETSP1074-20121228/114186_1 /TAXON_ID=2916 /ORGANISM="Ceratium fusus, Strain PA161109" /LENGTH=110 /DNA_ID=CAMNT_0013565227 /DNA_START=74 /DNA_END=406 /DNA_ORIENTATION=+
MWAFVALASGLGTCLPVGAASVSKGLRSSQVGRQLTQFSAAPHAGASDVQIVLAATELPNQEAAMPVATAETGDTSYSEDSAHDATDFAAQVGQGAAAASADNDDVEALE